MIKTIMSGPGIEIQNSYASSQYVNMNSSNPAAGQVRFNGTMMEVYDGSMWAQIQMSHPTISLNGSAIAALDWVQKKMADEHRIKELAKTNVTIADALASYELAAEKLKVVLTLTDDTV
jgi:hypothetical protein